MTRLDRIEAHVTAIHDGDVLPEADQLAAEVAPLLPLLRALVEADASWTEAVVGASVIPLEECTRRAGEADDAVCALLAALRDSGGGR